MKRTKKEFDLFFKESSYWINELQLNEWETTIILSGNVDDDVGACCSADLSAQMATLYLNQNVTYKEEREDEIVKGYALHEVLELLLSELRFLAMERNFDYNTYDAASHRVIHKVQRLLEKYDSKNRKNIRKSKPKKKRDSSV